MKILQYQSCTGTWIDVDVDRRTEFLDMCVKHNSSIKSHDDAIEAMANGTALRNDAADWYSNCRMFDKAAHEKKMAAYNEAENKRRASLIKCRACGQTGHAGSYPFSTMGGSNVCDDCC